MSVQATPAFHFSASTPWEEIGPGLKRQIMGYDDKIMLVKVAFEAGAVGEVHSHPHSQVAYVESGVFELTIGEEVQTLRAGDSYYVLPHVLHGCVCKEAGVLVDVFSPAREDFLG